MNTFTVNEKTYKLFGIEDLPEMTLGDVEILERVGGLDVNNLSSIPVTVRLVLAFVYVSMLRSDPKATLEDAKLVKITVLEQLAESIANTTDDAAPPTEPGAVGVPVSVSDSDSSPGIWTDSRLPSGA